MLRSKASKIEENWFSDTVEYHTSHGLSISLLLCKRKINLCLKSLHVTFWSQIVENNHNIEFGTRSRILNKKEPNMALA